MSLPTFKRAAHSRRVPRLTAMLVALVAMPVAGCGGSSPPAAPKPTPTTAPVGSPATPVPQGQASGRVVRVPNDHATIQGAVDAAGPGDLVLIGPGIYRESVIVARGKDRLVIRGVDRNRVILDGSNSRLDGVMVHADAVAVENLTVRRYTANGVVFTPDPRNPTRLIQGYRASYVTAAGNGLYGLYALSAQHGRFDHDYASGSPDSGIYVGQCRHCNALVVDSTVERNMVGLEDTNASGGLVFARNIVRANRVGIALNSQRRERYAPQSDTTIVGNVVDGRGASAAPKGDDAYGLGIVVAGGARNRILRNRFVHASVAAVVLESSVDGYPQLDNEVRANAVVASPLAVSLVGAVQGSCLASLIGVQSTEPPRLATAARCGRATTTLPSGQPVGARSVDGPDYRSVPLPGPQPTMPDAAHAPAVPAVGLPGPLSKAMFAMPKEPG